MYAYFEYMTFLQQLLGCKSNFTEFVHVFVIVMRGPFSFNARDFYQVCDIFV